MATHRPLVFSVSLTGTCSVPSGKRRSTVYPRRFRTRATGSCPRRGRLAVRSKISLGLHVPRFRSLVVTSFSWRLPAAREQMLDSAWQGEWQTFEYVCAMSVQSRARPNSCGWIRLMMLAHPDPRTCLRASALQRERLWNSKPQLTGLARGLGEPPLDLPLERAMTRPDDGGRSTRPVDAASAFLARRSRRSAKRGGFCLGVVGAG
jgi:hypothetical protein